MSDFAEALVKEGITVNAIKYAIEIAKDEEVRVVWQRICRKAYADNPNSETEFKRTNALGRKMFTHHATGKSYPWKLDDLREGRVSDKEVDDYLTAQTDPEPKSNFARPQHT